MPSPHRTALLLLLWTAAASALAALHAFTTLAAAAATAANDPSMVLISSHGQTVPCASDCMHGSCDNVTGMCWCDDGWTFPCDDMRDARCNVCSAQGTAVSNGLAQRPPMGWVSWQRFGCRVDCSSDAWGSDDCLSEGLVRATADSMVADGYAALGYTYINIDDCWADHDIGRDPTTNKLVADHLRFSGGMASLSAYVHGKKLKFGLYSAANPQTCAGWPASLGHEELDAQTFAAWGVDSLKYDGCNTNITDYIASYPAMGRALNKTGRRMLFSCSWPVYQRLNGVHANYQLLQHIGCNLWRFAGDMQDRWGAIVDIVDYYATQCTTQVDLDHSSGAPFCESFLRAQAPGHWNDPDQLVLGNGVLSQNEEAVQMAMWCLFAAPLYMGNDLRSVPASSKALLQNVELIAVDQDALGRPATRVRTVYPWGSTAGLQLWRREVEPCRVVAANALQQCDIIVAMLNTASVDSGVWLAGAGGVGQSMPYRLQTTASELGIEASATLKVRDLVAQKELPQIVPGGYLSAIVSPHSVQMFRLTPTPAVQN